MLRQQKFTNQLAMNKFWTATLFNVLGIFGLTSIIALAGGGQEAFLFAPIIIAFLELLVAFVLLIPVKTRRAAQIMLMATGIVFLIGFGICTAFPFNLR